MLRFSKAFLAGALLTFQAHGAAAQEHSHAEEPVAEDVIALMGTIPIYWGEVAGFDELMSGDAEPHWARAVLERRGALAPLDYLSQEALAPHRRLLLAQPRGFSGEENVALDGWVRGGGRLLLFADPWMTGESRFHIGDRRRPQDVALLSPILARWGLELISQNHELGGGLHHVEREGQLLPIDSWGEFRLLADRDNCELELAGLLAHCRIGAGEVLIMADAAILDLGGPYPQAESALESLLSEIFPEIGENAGNPHWIREASGESDGNLRVSAEGLPPGIGELGDNPLQ